jgi:hypothetical protein
MSETPLEEVQRLIRELTPESRLSLTDFLASFPDSGLQSYDLSEELEIIKQAHKIKPPQHTEDSNFLFELLVPMRNVVVIAIAGHSVLHVIFRPDRFVKGFPAGGPNLYKVVSDGLREDLFTGEKKEKVREQRRASGIVEDDADFEQAITDTCDATAKDIVNAKAARVAELISLHLPRMVGDMFDAALQGQTFADLNAIARDLGQPERQIPTPKLKQMLTKRYWEDVKPHLGITRKTRTNPAWTPESKKEFAQRVSDRRGLAARIKEMFDDCEGEETWVEDLKQDSTFQLLEPAVDQDSIKWAIKRIASEDLPPRDREPLSVACEIARRELDLPEQVIETLRNYYSEGIRAVKADRKASDRSGK